MKPRKVRRRSSQELGIGDAVLQLMNVQRTIWMTPADCLDPILETQKEQLLTALNTYTVDMGFECRFDPTENLYEAAEVDDSPTPVAIIKKGAFTSCCRVVRTGTEKSARKKGRG